MGVQRHRVFLPGLLWNKFNCGRNCGAWTSTLPVKTVQPPLVVDFTINQLLYGLKLVYTSTSDSMKETLTRFEPATLGFSLTANVLPSVPKSPADRKATSDPYVSLSVLAGKEVRGEKPQPVHIAALLKLM